MDQIPFDRIIKARELVKKQRERLKLNCHQKSTVQKENESNLNGFANSIFNGFTLRLNFGSKNLISTNDIPVWENHKPKQLQQQDNKVMEPENDNLDQPLVNHDVVANDNVAVATETTVSKPSKEDEEDAPKWISPPPNMFLLQSKYIKKSSSVKTSPNAKTTVEKREITKLKDPSRSMSNLPVKKLDVLLTTERDKQTKQDKPKQRVKPYPSDEIQQYMKKKKLRECRKEKNDNRRERKQKHYNVEEIRDFIRKKRREREKQQEIKSESVKCTRNYDVSAVREYMAKKKESPKKDVSETTKSPCNSPLNTRLARKEFSKIFAKF